MAFKLLYVEDCVNNFCEFLIGSPEIELFLLRFSSFCDFSAEHMQKTANIPVFYIDRKGDFCRECEKLSEFVEQNGGIDYFYNDSEFNQIYIQKVASYLKFPGALTGKQAELVRDKAAMKGLLQSIGIPCQKFSIIESKDEIRNLLDVWTKPVIVKIRDGFSSQNVFKIYGEKDIDSLDISLENKRFMAEEYNRNKIWCIDSIVTEGNVVCNFFTWLPFTNLDFAENKERFIQLAVGMKPENFDFSPLEFTQKIITAIGLKRGYLHLEAFIDKNGKPSVCEFAWRTPGDNMLNNLSKVYGISIPELLLHALMGKKITVNPVENVCVADAFLPVKAGKIVRISGLKDFYSLSGVNICGGEIKYKVGDSIDNEHRYTDSSGWVQIKASSIEEIMVMVTRVYEEFYIEMEKEQ